MSFVKSLYMIRVCVQNHLTRKILYNFLISDLVDEIFKFILPTHQQIMNDIKLPKKLKYYPYNYIHWAVANNELLYNLQNYYYTRLDTVDKERLVKECLMNGIILTKSMMKNKRQMIRKLIAL